MGLLAIILIGFAGWMIWTGRLQRLNANDGIALGLAILGALVAARGNPFIGGVPLILSMSYVVVRLRNASRRQARIKPKPKARPKPKPKAEPIDEAVAEAAALLGVARDADAESIRAAHRRLIASVHPDKGGTEALAAKINAARDTMLRHHEKSIRSRQ